MVFVLTLLLVFLFGFSSSSLALLQKGVLRPQYPQVEEQPLCGFHNDVFRCVFSVVWMGLFVSLLVFFFCLCRINMHYIFTFNCMGKRDKIDGRKR